MGSPVFVECRKQVITDEGRRFGATPRDPQGKQVAAQDRVGRASRCSCPRPAPCPSKSAKVVLVSLERPAGAPAPVFPGAVDAERAGASDDVIDFALGEEFDLTHLHRVLLQSRVHLEVDGYIDSVPDVVTDDGGAMATHQRHQGWPKRRSRSTNCLDPSVCDN
jgi:hypothetical protein